jgi:hypothetical protein
MRGSCQRITAEAIECTGVEFVRPVTRMSL